MMVPALQETSQIARFDILSMESMLISMLTYDSNSTLGN